MRIWIEHRENAIWYDIADRAVLYALAIIVGTWVTGCGEAVSVQRPIDAIEAAGFTDVRITGKHGVAPTFSGCGKDDAVAFDAEATNPAGKRVTITACCGLVLKGCTLRH